MADLKHLQLGAFNSQPPGQTLNLGFSCRVHCISRGDVRPCFPATSKGILLLARAVKRVAELVVPALQVQPVNFRLQSDVAFVKRGNFGHFHI